MSITFGDNLKHNNPNFPIADITDIKGGLRSIATFSDASLLSEFASGAGGTEIPEKYKTGYSLMLERSTGTIYYLSGISATNSSDWTPIGSGGTGTTNSIAKWIGSTSLGDSLITDNGDTVTVNGNLMVIGTTSTINSENLLVKDPIILLAGSQSGVPTYDAGLFINRGSSDTQAFIWDESETEFKFINTTSGATVSGDVTIGTYSSVRTGVLSVGTGNRANSRFLVSSSGGTVSLVVDEFGNVYNRGRGNISTNTVFGESALSLNTGGYSNTAIGVNTLLLNTTGHANTAIGLNSLSSNISGNRNNALGFNSLYSNTMGVDNTAIGFNSLFNNTIGVENTALGNYSLNQNTTGNYNTALGHNSLSYNTSGVFLTFSWVGGTGYVDGTYSNVTLVYATGSIFTTAPIVDILISAGEVSSVTQISNGTGFKDTTTIFTINSYGTYSVGSGFEIGVIGLFSANYNTAVGYTSLYSNKIGYNNIAVGAFSLSNNETGLSNTALGNYSLLLNTTGTNNTAVGYRSLYNNTTSESNIAIGDNALYSNTSGDANTAVGRDALYFNKGDWNTAVGYISLQGNTTGNYNTAIGIGSLANNQTGSDNIGIGRQAGVFRFGGGLGATNSNNSIFIGYNTMSGATNSNNTNEIVIGYEAIGNGPNSVTLGNNSITRTYLKGKVVIADGTQGAGKVLTSDASGLSSWATISFGGGSGGTSSFYIKGGTVSSYDTTSDIYRTGYLNIGSGTASDGRFVVSSTTGTVSLVVDNNGNVYNRSRGTSNTAFGDGALKNLTSGNSNIAIGVNAGVGVLTAATNSIFIGTDTTAQQNSQTNQIVIGVGATGSGSNTVTLGNNDIVATYLKGDVQTNGTMTATGFFNSSDIRLKDIVERDGDTIKFTWKDKRDDKIHIGYVAQEVQQKYPNQVNENTDGLLVVNYIEVLVAKIQQLENRIKILESK